MSIALQRCESCGAFQYPRRDLCRICLSDDLRSEEREIAGRVVSEAKILRSLDPAQLAEGPVRIGAIATDCGVRIVALLARNVAAGARVILRSVPGRLHAIEAVTAGLDEKDIQS